MSKFHASLFKMRALTTRTSDYSFYQSNPPMETFIKWDSDKSTGGQDHSKSFQTHFKNSQSAKKILLLEKK